MSSVSTAQLDFASKSLVHKTSHLRHLRSEQNQRYYQYHKKDILARRRLLRARIEQLETFIKENGLVPPSPPS
ncbi:6740_t:CDS:1, partial [Gigaspora margarita]